MLIHGANSAQNAINIPSKFVFSIFCVLLLLLGASSFAQAQNSPHLPPNNLDESLEVYGRLDKYCLEWTDDCVNCVRDRAGNSSGCSNIGIACQAKEIRCLRRLELSSYATCDLLLKLRVDVVRQDVGYQLGRWKSEDPGIFRLLRRLGIFRHWEG